LNSKSTFSNSTSRSYAIALYELSKEGDLLNKIEEEMKSINKLLNDSSDFKEMILSPTVSKENKKKVLFMISEQNNFSTVLKKFLGFIAEKNRLFFLDKIINSFLNLVSKSKGELKAKLVSSKKLSIKEQKTIQENFSKDFKSKLKIEYEHDPRLLAGLIIQVGSVMIDTSLRTKMRKLEKIMVEA